MVSRCVLIGVAGREKHDVSLRETALSHKSFIESGWFLTLTFA